LPQVDSSRRGIFVSGSSPSIAEIDLPRSQHAPTKLLTYIRVHETRMEHFRSSGFVVTDSLAFTITPSGVLLDGEISCLGRIVIGVRKTLVVLDGEGNDSIVQTATYAYNAWVGGFFNFLRHDNSHTHPGHGDAHHRHVFDWRTGDHKAGSPSWCGEEGWPVLGDFIQEVSDWYWEHLDELPALDAEPRTAQRR
jgi:hypothetical protein